MRFNIASIPADVVQATVQVGNVYPAQGNRPTSMWVVVAVRDRSACMLGLDAEGNVCSAQTYNCRALEDRPVIGLCAGIGDMKLDVEFTGVGRTFRGV